MASNGTAVITQPDQREVALLKAIGLDRLSAEQRELAIHIANRYDLDLMLKHIVMVDGRPYITRDGLLHIAHRSGQLDGIETTDPVVIDKFWTAKASVYRKDMSRPFTYGGRYPVDGQNRKFGPEMALKVAESMALRRAFDVAAPVAEERWDAEQPVSASASAPSLAERAAARAAEVETVRVIEPLSKRQFVDAYRAEGIPDDYVTALRADMFPDAKDLTDAQRGELLAALTVPASPIQAAPSDEEHDDAVIDTPIATVGGDAFPEFQ